MCNKQPKQTGKRQSKCAEARFQFTLCYSRSFQLLCDPSFFLNQWLTLHFFLQVIQSEESGCGEGLRSGKTIAAPSCLSRCRSHVRSNRLFWTPVPPPAPLPTPSVPLLPSLWPVTQKEKKTSPQQTEKCLPLMCQVCFLSVAVSQLPKPARLKGPLGASRALFRFCSPVRNLQPPCEGLGVVCSRPSACPTRWHRAQSAHMLLWFSTEEKLTGGSVPRWKSLCLVCTSLKQRGSGCHVAWQTDWESWEESLEFCPVWVEIEG